MKDIRDSFEDGKGLKSIFHNERNKFLQEIWNQSMNGFDIPREIQVVIDSNNELFMSVGTPSFVSFTGQDESLYGKNNEKKMKLPIKCWVHTHPFGKAYFSGTDISTINTWKPHMMSAIVLGDNEHQIWQKVKPGIAKHIRYVTETIVELGTKNKIDKMVEELI
mgnify:FL=1